MSATLSSPPATRSAVIAGLRQDAAAAHNQGFVPQLVVRGSTKPAQSPHHA